MRIRPPHQYHREQSRHNHNPHDKDKEHPTISIENSRHRHSTYTKHNIMNQKEFEAIASALHKQASAQARLFLREDADAADIAQDAMLKLWALHDELHDKEHSMRLAKTMARHLAIDSLRHTRRTTTLFVTMDKSSEDDGSEWQPPDTKALSPHLRMEVEEDEQWLLERISTLPKREMQVMKMRQTEQMSNSEIANIMGITTASVSTMLSSARKKIFEDLKKRNRQ